MPQQHLLSLFASVLLFCVSFCGAIPTAAAVTLPTTPVVGAIFHFSGSRPTHLGVSNGALAPCPATPNCVSSQAQDEAHGIAPLHYDDSSDVAFRQVKAILQSQPHAELVKVGDRYLYAEFTSNLMGFVDDVEFYLDPGEKVIQVRSASRLGESDLGVNRQRIETIRAALSQKVD